MSLASLFKSLDKNNLHLVLNEEYDSCVIYSESICNYTFAESVTRKDIHSYFFFFKNKGIVSASTMDHS